MFVYLEHFPYKLFRCQDLSQKVLMLKTSIDPVSYLMLFNLPGLIPRILHPLPLINRMFLSRIQIHSSFHLAITFCKSILRRLLGRIGSDNFNSWMGESHSNRWVYAKKNHLMAITSAGREPAWHAGGRGQSPLGSIRYFNSYKNQFER